LIKTIAKTSTNQIQSG